MATATIIDSKKAESQRKGSLPAPPRALRLAARAFLRLARAAGVWQAARAVRDAQRVSEVTHRWEHVWAELAASGDAADRRLDRVAHQIAADARTVLRSGLAIVFRLDAASGALHSLGVDGEVIPGDLVPAVP